jgi:AcrR family transcriptional regulator
MKKTKHLLPTDLTRFENFRLPTSFDDVTPEWLTKMLQCKAPGVVVKSIEVSYLTEGTGTRARLSLDYNRAGVDAGLPKTMWLKSWFNALRDWHLQAGSILGEIVFYRFAPQLPVRAAGSYYAGVDETGQGLVLMEDLKAADATFLGASDSLTLDQVRDGVDQLARLHAVYWDMPHPSADAVWPAVPNGGALGKLMLEQVFPNMATIMAQPHLQGRLPADLSPERLSRALTNYLHRVSRSPICLLHFDAHLGNVAMRKTGEIFFVDWQFFRAGAWFHDVSYFVTSAITTQNRRQWERELLEYYLGRLRAHGATPPSLDAAWEDYVVGQVYGVLSWVCAMLEMQSIDTIYAFLDRAINAVMDLGTIDHLLASPEPFSG